MTPADARPTGRWLRRSTCLRTSRWSRSREAEGERRDEQGGGDGVAVRHCVSFSLVVGEHAALGGRDPAPHFRGEVLPFVQV